MDPRYASGTVIPGTIYEVVREIGAGGMGRVYEVEDTTIRKRYALKALFTSNVSAAELVERIKHEARTMVRVAHTNIVDVITAGMTGDGSPFYVMELLVGRSLRALLKKRRTLPVIDAVVIGSDVAEGLVKAHALGVIHRDIKPDNLFAVHRSDGTTLTKILDFGVANILADLGVRIWNADGSIAGTPRYSPPEQQAGAPASPQMDIWALAYVVFEIIAGVGPFREGPIEEVLARILGPQPAHRLSEFVPNVPPRLEKLLAWALEKNPARRLASMATFAMELRAIYRELEAATWGPLVDENTTQEDMRGMLNQSSPGEEPLPSTSRPDPAQAPERPFTPTADAPKGLRPAFGASEDVPPADRLAGFMDDRATDPGAPAGMPLAITDGAHHDDGMPPTPRVVPAVSERSSGPQSFDPSYDSSRRFVDPAPTPPSRDAEEPGWRVLPAAGRPPDRKVLPAAGRPPDRNAVVFDAPPLRASPIPGTQGTTPSVLVRTEAPRTMSRKAPRRPWSFLQWPYLLAVFIATVASGVFAISYLHDAAERPGSPPPIDPSGAAASRAAPPNAPVTSSAAPPGAPAGSVVTSSVQATTADPSGAAHPSGDALAPPASQPPRRRPVPTGPKAAPFPAASGPRNPLDHLDELLER